MLYGRPYQGLGRNENCYFKKSYLHESEFDNISNSFLVEKRPLI